MGVADFTVAGLVFIFVIFGCLDYAQSQNEYDDSPIQLQLPGGATIADKYFDCIFEWNIPFNQTCHIGRDTAEFEKRVALNANFERDFLCGDIPLGDVKAYLQIHCYRLGRCNTGFCTYGRKRKYDQDKKCDEELKAFRSRSRPSEFDKKNNCTEEFKEFMGDTTTTSSCDQPIPYCRLLYILLTTVFIVLLVLGPSFPWTSVATTSQ